MEYIIIRFKFPQAFLAKISLFSCVFTEFNYEFGPAVLANDFSPGLFVQNNQPK